MEHVILTGNDVFHQAVSRFIDVDVFLNERKEWKEQIEGEMVGKKREEEAREIDECKHFYKRNKTSAAEKKTTCASR